MDGWAHEFRVDRNAFAITNQIRANFVGDVRGGRVFGNDSLFSPCRLSSTLVQHPPSRLLSIVRPSHRRALLKSRSCCNWLTTEIPEPAGPKPKSSMFFSFGGLADWM